MGWSIAYNAEHWNNILSHPPFYKKDALIHDIVYNVEETEFINDLILLMLISCYNYSLVKFECVAIESIS